MRVAPIVASTVAVTIATAAWVVITTIADGTTYHLFPLLIGAAGPVFARYAARSRLTTVESLVSVSDGIIGWIAGWLVLVSMDQWPSATVIADQPGGVGGETVVLGLAGAAVGLAYSHYRRSS